MKLWALIAVLGAAVVTVAGATGAPGSDVRLTNDCVIPATPDPGPGYTVPPGCRPGTQYPGYVSSYAIATNDYSYDANDPVLRECSIAHGRQNEPAVEVDPRNPSVLIGSSNDYCGVYAYKDAAGNPVAAGPIWLGYYRSEDMGHNFRSSLVPGYPGDATPYAALAQIRTASAGDPVIAWDAEGRVFLGSESSDDPAGSPKTFGDVWVARYENPAGPGGPTIQDGKRYTGTTLVSRGSSAPNLLGVFNDKTAIAADHNSDGRCDNDVYFAYSRFNGNGANAMYFTRSTDHGVTFTRPSKLSQPVQDVQFGDIAITGNSNVYVAFRGFARANGQPDAVYITRSTDCGQTFSPVQLVTTFTPYDAQDVPAPEATPPPPAGGPVDVGLDEEAPSGTARDCGDFASACESGYTFFRRDTQVRATANQYDQANPDRIYLVYDPSKPGTEVPTGTTYGSIDVGVGSQSGIYYAAWNGAAGAFVPGLAPRLIDNQPLGHQLFPDISADTQTGPTVLHALWWDSRLDLCYSPTRPVGNCANRTTIPSLDSWGAVSTNQGLTWTSGRVERYLVEPELRAVLGPHRAVRRRLPVGDAEPAVADVRLRRVDRLARHRPGHRPARAARGRGCRHGGCQAVPRRRHAHRKEGRNVPDLERRPLPALRRHRPEHLRRPDALTLCSEGRPFGRPSSVSGRRACSARLWNRPTRVTDARRARAYRPDEVGRATESRR